MNTIRNFFLGGRHWQIFLLLTLPYLAAMAVEVNLAPFPASPTGGNGIGDSLFVGLMLFWMFSALAWFWTLGSFFRSLVEPKRNLRLFRVAIVYPAVFTFALLPVMVNPQPARIAIIFPLDLLAMLCLFYCLYFIARNMVLAETGKAEKFYDYAGPFFLLWFFPIGVWFLQPRINRLYAERGNRLA